MEPTDRARILSECGLPAEGPVATNDDAICVARGHQLIPDADYLWYAGGGEGAFAVRAVFDWRCPTRVVRNEQYEVGYSFYSSVKPVRSR